MMLPSSSSSVIDAPAITKQQLFLSLRVTCFPNYVVVRVGHLVVEGGTEHSLEVEVRPWGESDNN